MLRNFYVVLILTLSFAHCRSWGKFWATEILYPVNTLQLTQRVAMTPVTPTLPGSPGSCSASPALPDGLSLATDCTISGTPTRGQGILTYRITADLGADTLSVELKIRVYFQPKFAYTMNANDGTISRYLILTNGQLSFQNSIASATQAWFGLPSPDHKFLYVANKAAAQITVYTIDSTNGTLTAISGSPFSTLAAPHSLSLNPTGTMLYVGHDNTGVQGVTVFSVNPATGSLSALNGGAAYVVAAGSAPGTVTVEPGGKHLYVGSTQNAINAYAFRINETNGAISQLSGSPYVAINDAIAVVVHPTGNFVYFAQYFVAANGIMAFKRDPGTGSLEQISGPFATGNSPTGLTVSVSGNFMYVANSGANSVSGFQIDTATGILTPTPSSPYNTGGGVQGVAIDETVKYMYAANSSTDNVVGFQINSTTGDLLTPTPGGPYTSGDAPVHIVVVGSNP